MLNSERFNKILTLFSVFTLALAVILILTLGLEWTSSLARCMGALGAAGIAVFLYVIFTFRKVPKPTDSIALGVSAILSVAYNLAMVLATFAVFGHLFGVETDNTLIAALLATTGFSLYATIVTLRRIGENMATRKNDSFAKVVTTSLVQTLGPLLSLSIPALLVLSTMILLGTSMNWFALAMIIGVASATYSSLFVSTQILGMSDHLRRIFIKLRS